MNGETMYYSIRQLKTSNPFIFTKFCGYRLKFTSVVMSLPTLVIFILLLQMTQTSPTKSCKINPSDRLTLIQVN